MRNSILSICLLVMESLMGLSAQNIGGRVQSEDGQPLEFANVVAISLPDSAFVEGTTSAQDGSFALKAQPGGNLLLRISSIGYVSRLIPSENDLNAIVLKEDALTLSETVITAQKALVRTEDGSTSYDVKDDEDARTYTILEMLRKVPYISVDFDGNITIKGSGNIRIYENGRLNNSYTSNPRQVLSAIPASQVDHFEVITAPGARYDAEGVDGILNIVMKRDASSSGLSGQAGVSYKSGQALASLFLGARAGKVDLAVHYSGARLFKKNTRSDTYNTYHYTNSGDNHVLDHTMTNPGWEHILGVESSWQMDSLNLLSVSLDAVVSRIKIFGGGSMTLTDEKGGPIYRYDESYDDSNENYYDVNAKVDYEHKSARHAGEVLTLSYLLSTSDYHYQIGEDFYSVKGVDPGYRYYYRDNDGLFVEHTFQADWQRPFGRHHVMNLGAKYIRRSNNAQAESLYDQVRGSWSDFSHITDIGALYGEYAFKGGPFTLSAGLRLELAHLKARFHDHSQEGFSRDISDLVPFMSMGLRLSDKHSLSFNYASRVERPGITYLNPFHEETITEVLEGNPNLKSSRPDKVTLSYSYISSRLQMGVNLDGSFVSDGISRVVKIIDDRLHRTYGNNGRINYYGVSGFLRYQPFEGTDITLNLIAFNSKFDNRSLGISNPHNGWSGSLTVNQQLPLGLRLTAYAGRNDFPVTDLYRISCPYYETDFSLQKSLLKDNRLIVSVSAENLFLSKYLEYKGVLRQGEMLGDTSAKKRRGYLGFALTYRFGKMGSGVQKTGKTIQNDDLVGKW